MSLMTKRALLGVTAAAALTALVGCGKRKSRRRRRPPRLRRPPRQLPHRRPSR